MLPDSLIVGSIDGAIIDAPLNSIGGDGVSGKVEEFMHLCGRCVMHGIQLTRTYSLIIRTDPVVSSFWPSAL